MNSELPAVPVSKGLLWTGRILGGLPALFLLMDGVMHWPSRPLSLRRRRKWATPNR